jgi:hypothetical protein
MITRPRFTVAAGRSSGNIPCRNFIEPEAMLPRQPATGSGPSFFFPTPAVRNHVRGCTVVAASLAGGMWSSSSTNDIVRMRGRIAPGTERDLPADRTNCVSGVSYYLRNGDFTPGGIPGTRLRGCQINRLPNVPLSPRDSRTHDRRRNRRGVARWAARAVSASSLLKGP